MKDGTEHKRDNWIGRSNNYGLCIYPSRRNHCWCSHTNLLIVGARARERELQHNHLSSDICLKGYELIITRTETHLSLATICALNGGFLSTLVSVLHQEQGRA